MSRLKFPSTLLGVTRSMALAMSGERVTPWGRGRVVGEHWLVVPSTAQSNGRAG